MAEKKAARPYVAAPRSATKQTPKRDLTGAKAAFVGWLCDPSPEPVTLTALAKVLGVERATLSDWKHDPYVVAQLEAVEQRRQATWAQVTANLERIALQRGDDFAAVAAAKELGKLWRKYPSEKIEVTQVQRVAYVDPGALRDLALKQYPELRAN